MKRNVFGILLVFFGYCALYQLGQPLADRYDAVSRVSAKVFYPLRWIEYRQLSVQTESGTLQHSSADRWNLTYTVPKTFPQNGLFGAREVSFRVPSHLSPAVAATQGKIVDVTIGWEPDSDHFNEADFVLRSVTLSP
jgi:hypothetical protein